MLKWGTHLGRTQCDIRIPETLCRGNKLLRIVFRKDINSFYENVAPVRDLGNLIAAIERNRLCSGKRPLINTILRKEKEITIH